MRCGATGRSPRGGAHALLLTAVAVACASEPPSPHQAVLREAEAELAVGDAASARAGFLLAQDLAPDDPAALAGLALAELRLDRPAAALGWFDQRERVRADAFDAEMTVARCDALLAAVTAELDRAAWAVAIDLAEQTPSALVCRGEPLSALAIRARVAGAAQARDANQMAAAIEHLERVLAEQPGHPDATLASVELLLGEGAQDQALRLLSEALAHHPKDERLIEATVDLLAEP